MRRIMLFVLVGIALVVGLVALPPAPVVQAGRNGQQLAFVMPGGNPKISWLYVHGMYYTGKTETWSKTLNPPVTSYDLTNYWWKGHIDIQWRLANGVSGSCTVDVPESMPSDWITVDVSRYGGRGCYASR